MASLVKNVAKEYDTTKSYSYGDYVIYDKMLYMCISSTTGTFDSECWEEKYLTDVMNGKSDYYDADYIAPTYDSDNTYNTDDAVIYDGVLFICKEDNVTGTFNVSKWNKSSIIECGELNSNLGGLKPELLWTNTTSGTEFGAQTIPLDLTKYDGVFIEWQLGKSDNRYISYTYIPKGQTSGVGCVNPNNTGKALGRTVTVNESSVVFTYALNGTESWNGHIWINHIYGASGLSFE